MSTGDESGPAGSEANVSRAQRADRLLLWYPATWRARYGEEFTELLVAELAERPRSVRRTADVAMAGLRARLAAVGLASHPLDQAAAARATIATMACAVAVFCTVGAAQWSQLAIAMSWTSPGNRVITQALQLMSGAMLAFVVLAGLAAAPLIHAAFRSCAAGDGRRLAWPAMLIISGALVLLLGGRHFQNGWPGTGGHLLPHQGLVPSGLAAFGWATTMWITSYWAHPAYLSSFPPGQLAWMAASPAAIGILVTGAVCLLRRVRLSARELRYETWLATIAGAIMLAFLGGAACWLARAGREGQIFHVGAIDDAGLAVLVLAAAAGVLAIRRITLASRPSRMRMSSP